MNRREFLQRVPACASVPALLSLPVVTAQTRVVKPWLRELEAKINEIPESFWRARDDIGTPRNYQVSVNVLPPKDNAFRLWGELAGRINATSIGVAPPGTVAVREGWWTETDGAFAFNIRQVPWFMFLRPNQAWSVITDANGAKLYPEIDFYSL